VLELTTGAVEMAEGPQPAKETVPPYALALVVCDAIWADPSTGKRTILGCFSTITAVEFPALHPVMCIYAVITDGHGKVPVALRLIDVDEDRQPVFELRGELQFPDPRIVLEIDFVAQSVVFPEPGEYRLQLMSGPHLLMVRRILVLKPGEPKDEIGQ